jgi:hypothetical protein
VDFLQKSAGRIVATLILNIVAVLLQEVGNTYLEFVDDIKRVV